MHAERIYPMESLKSIMQKDICAAIGKRVRLSRILKDGKAAIFAFDHGFEHGPTDFTEENMNPRKIVGSAVESNFDAIMLTKGVAEVTHDLWLGRTPLIVKLTGKTSLKPPEGQLLQYSIGSVDDAVRLGADGVAATVYWGSPHEEIMAERFQRIVTRCEEYGLPTMILAYPRGPSIISSYDERIVLYASRASLEVGADLIKTHYTGSTESFGRVVRSVPIPVMMSGGGKTETPKDFLHLVKSVMDAGSAGVVVGRNVFQSADFRKVASAVIGIVHNKMAPEDFD